MVSWSAVVYGDNYLYRMNLHNYGVKLSPKEDGSTQTYHFTFVFLDEAEEIVIRRDEFADWTDYAKPPTRMPLPQERSRS